MIIFNIIVADGTKQKRVHVRNAVINMKYIEFEKGS